MNKRLTIADIAKLAGVAKSSVSSVLNNKSKVSPAKRQEILNIMAEHNYVPQVSARSLSTRQTYQIGYLVSTKVTLGLANDYFSTILSGVNTVCQERDYQNVVSTYDLSTLQDFVMPPKLSQHSVDGLILAGVVSEDVLEQLAPLHIPYIVIGGDYNNDVLYLRNNMVETYASIIRYFQENGHKTICHISSIDKSLKNFNIALNDINSKKSESLMCICEKNVFENEFESGIKFAQKWLKQSPFSRFTALLANDQICSGFLMELGNHGVKCPEEISIFAGCDTALSRWNCSPLSAIATPLFKQGCLAANLLIDLLQKKKTREKVKTRLDQEYEACDLVIRKTTGKAPER